MNKTELIAAVAEKSGISKKDAEKAVSSTIETIINTVAEGEKIQIAASKAPKFKPAKALKEAVK